MIDFVTSPEFAKAVKGTFGLVLIAGFLWAISGGSR